MRASTVSASVSKNPVSITLPANFFSVIIIAPITFVTQV